MQLFIVLVILSLNLHRTLSNDYYYDTGEPILENYNEPFFRPLPPILPFPNIIHDRSPQYCVTPQRKAGICLPYYKCADYYERYERFFDPNDFSCWLPHGGGFFGVCCPNKNFVSSPPDNPSRPQSSRPQSSRPHSPRPPSSRPPPGIHVTHPIPPPPPPDIIFPLKPIRPVSQCKEKPKKQPIDSTIEEEYDTEDGPINITDEIVENAVAAGERLLKKYDTKNKLLLKANSSVIVKKGTPSYGHLRFTSTSEKINQISKIGDIFFETSKEIDTKLKLHKDQIGTELKKFNISDFESLYRFCPSEPLCDLSKYRAPDGSCNNNRKPKMGKSLTTLIRLLPAAYEDGRWGPRNSYYCTPLPSARLLSQAFIKDCDKNHKQFSLFLMQMGQFLDHDFTAVPVYRFENQSGIECCYNGHLLPKPLRHKHCYPIEIPLYDPFYGPYGQTCMNFVRSRIGPRNDCSLGFADQINSLTHWIDASNIYGSDSDEQYELRYHQDGLLKFSVVNGQTILLPLKESAGRDMCTDPINGVFCFQAGDIRVNEMLGLVVTHLVWFREHNRVAIELKEINPYWTDEELFQETRRIVTAEYQHIIYKEWLPNILGEDYMRENDILPLSQEYYDNYDGNLDGSISTEFASAAFRMGHTLVQGIVHLINDVGKNDMNSVISQNSNNPHGIRNAGAVDKWIRGLTRQPIQQYDTCITEHINGRLFQGKHGKFGMDLSSLNIQRARDHGVPGYNFYKQYCHKKKAKTFDDFKDLIPDATVDKLKLYYDHVDDVDLWIGGLSEKPKKGQLIGPTFACIIGDQFVRSKRGDRYFYDLGDEAHSFSLDQLAEIRKASFARILCDNGDDIKMMQPSAFLLPDDESNPLVDCKDESIARLDLSGWKDEATPPTKK